MGLVRSVSFLFLFLSNLGCWGIGIRVCRRVFNVPGCYVACLLHMDNDDILYDIYSFLVC